ncbi:type III-A CRISPR-associated protein Cas10/Csm1 [uncultured Fusobacterium sp.]|uniref:type III-A CRISPR-associated protein Cas10/Csm1 n=1 Tax=uncultured Fusobacterium sp. TaxID=159267 RepID=UPI0025E86305|nr:type III-A CRISPR-associated protein Cas10/Csm1 [uncultured Fusobacterium sp.]
MVRLQDDKERVVLGGLLHDIGKFIGRSEKYMSQCHIGKKHPHLSWWFIKFLEEKKVIEEDRVLEELVLKHHEGNFFSEDINVAGLEDKYIRRLAYIVARADNYSSAERNEDEMKMRPFTKVPLDSIFGNIDIGRGKDRESKKRYKLKEFLFGNIFPMEFEENSQEELNLLIEKFLKEVEKIETESFKVLYTTLLELIRKYCWSIPSDTQKEICDLSLYDHLKTTSAISLATYNYVKDLRGSIEKATDADIKNAKLKDYFLLIAGDISGIQNYIFNLESTEGAGKRIRFRSFFIKIFTNMIAYKIIEELDLEAGNIIISSSGKFYILAQNTQETREKISKLKNEINRELYQKYYGEIFFNIEYLALTGDDLGLKFSKKYDEINDLLAEGKKLKFVKEVVELPVLDEEINEMKSVQQCKICGKRLVEKGNICEYCLKDFQLGELLPKLRKVAFYKEDSDVVGDIEILGVKCKLYKDEEIEGKPFLVQEYEEDIRGDYPWVREYYGGYTPIDSKGNSMSFEEIAQLSSSKNLGILKGDVDNLGLIMAYGLKIDDIDGEEKKVKDITSISRVATVSRMFDSFFSYWLKEKIKYENESYIVYSGGDDFMIVGAWDKLIDTAKEIRESFRKFVRDNENITLTCGVVLTKAKAPLFYGVKTVQEAEEFGKNSGKNGIVLFDTYIPWDRFYEVDRVINFIDENMKSGLFSQSFVYRLLRYTEMARKYSESKNGKYLKYISDFTYDIGRNISKKLKNPSSDERIIFLSRYFGMESIQSREKQRFLSEYMKVVLNYVVRKNRGGSDV